MAESGRKGAFELRDAEPFPVGKRARDKQMATEFSHNFSLYLEKANMSAADLSRENAKRMKSNPDWLDLQPYQITRYKTGKQTPKLNHLRQIAELLGITPHDLVPSYEGPTVGGGMRMGLKDLGNGKAMVDFSGAIDSDSAREIMVILARARPDTTRVSA